MLLSLVDSLRCPAPHEDSSLVLTVDTWSAGRVAEGTLGCPSCHARYVIHRGVTNFTSQPVPVRQEDPPVGADPARLAAQLGLAEPGGVVLLAGRYAMAHEALSDLTEVTCLLVNAPAAAGASAVSIVVADGLPLVDRILRGAAIDGDGTRFLTDVLRCVRPGGRIVGPAGSVPPTDLRLIAEDATEWVGEIASERPIQLLRGGARKV